MNLDSKLSRRGFVALTGATSLGALLAACGGGGDAAAPAAPAEAPPAEAPPAEAPPAEAPPVAAGADIRPGVGAGRTDHVLRMGRLRRHRAVDVAVLPRR